MQRALETPEILGLIFDLLDADDLPRCALVAVAWALEARRSIRLHRKGLGELVTRLPGDLITPGGVEALNVYSSTAYHEEFFPSAFSAVLPFRNRIVGNYVGPLTEEEALSEELALEETQNNPPINALNLPPWALFRQHMDLHQFVEILRRVARPDDLHDFLIDARCCWRLVYSPHETKDFLIFHALERLFPSLDFFPNLTEIVVSSCSHPDNPQSLHPESVGLYVPLSLTRRAKVLIIDDNRIFPTEETRIEPYRGTSSTELIFAGLSNLPSQALAQVVEFRHNVRWSIAVEGAPILPPSAFGPRLHRATLRNALAALCFQLHSTTLSIGPTALLQELTINQFLRLEELTLSYTCGELYSDTVWPIAERLQLPSIGQLHPGEHTVEPDPLPADSLPDLRKLTFRGFAISPGLSQIFKQVDLPALTHLVLDGNPPPRHALPDVADVLEMIAQRVPALEHLHVDIPIESPGRAFEDGPMEQQIEDERILDPLVLFGSLRALRHLHLVFPANAKLRLSPPAVRSTFSLLSKLPHLTHFHLNPFQLSESDLTLDTLVVIAQKYPKLACLGVPLDPSSMHLAHMPEVYHALMEGYNPSQITTLSVGLPKFSHPAGTVDALKIIFPCLEDFAVPSTLAPGPEHEDEEGGGSEEKLQRIAELSIMSDVIARRWHPPPASPLPIASELPDVPTAMALGATEDDDTEYFHDSDEDEEFLSDLTN